MIDVLKLMLVIAFDAALLAGAGWLCVYHGWSEWWLGLAILCVSEIDADNLLHARSWKKEEK